MSELIKRFTKEIKHDCSLYNLYLKGLWYPNIDEYHRFLKKIEKNNEHFSKTLKKYHLIKKNDKIIETALNKDYSISSFLNDDTTVIETSFGNINVSSSIQLNYYDICYISNGIYKETLDLVERLGNSSSFAIGICDNKESLFYKENIEKIESIKKILRKKHIKTKVLEIQEHRDNVYILTHRRDF